MLFPRSRPSRSAAVWGAVFWASCCAAGVAGAAFCRSNLEERFGWIQESDLDPNVADGPPEEKPVDWSMRLLRDNRLPGAALRRRSGVHFAFSIVFASLFILFARGSRIGFRREEGYLVLSRLMAGAALGLALHWPTYVSDIWVTPLSSWPNLDARYIWMTGEVIVVVVAALLLGAGRTGRPPDAGPLSDVSFLGAYATAKAAWMSGIYLNGIETACPYVTCFSSRPGAWAAAALICVTCVRLARGSPRAIVRLAVLPALVLVWACGAFIQLSWLRTYWGYEAWRLPGEIVPAAVCFLMTLTRIRQARGCDAALPRAPELAV